MRVIYPIFPKSIVIFVIIAIIFMGNIVVGQAKEGSVMPKVLLSVSDQKVNIGDTFEVAIWLQGFTGDYGNLQGIQLVVKYDPELIKPIKESSKFNVDAIFPSPDKTTLVNKIDDDGLLELATFLNFSSKSYFSGYGKLGLITFQALKTGEAKLEQTKSQIISPGNTGINIEHQINHPVIVIGDGAPVKESVQVEGTKPNSIVSTLAVEDVLKGFKDASEIMKISWAKDSVAKLANVKIVNGTPEGNFYPLRNMTRAEFAKVAVIGLGLDMKQVRTPTFSDIKTTDWYFDFVETAAAHGLINGIEQDGTRLFKPNNNITRAEIASILSKALVNIKGAASGIGSVNQITFHDIEGHWAKKFILHLHQSGVIKGKSETTFAPTDNATRAEISVLISRMLDME